MDSDNMKYSIDRIIEKIAILENLETKEIIEVNLEELPQDAKDGTILKLENNKYIFDQEIQPPSGEQTLSL